MVREEKDTEKVKAFMSSANLRLLKDKDGKGKRLEDRILYSNCTIIGEKQTVLF